jgi:hypothetical protein
MVRTLSVIGFILTLFSCQKKEESTIIRESLFLRDGGIKMQSDTIPASFREAIENGQHTLKDVDGKIISAGEFSSGFRVGPWMYHPTDSTAVEINWSLYANDTSGVKINFPTAWLPIEHSDRPFQASYPLRREEKSGGKYFIILSYDKDSVGADLHEYQRFYNSEMFAKDSVKEYAKFILETLSGRVFYFLRYQVRREEEEILILCLLGEYEDTIYDITYSSLVENSEEKHLVFFEMSRSFQLHGRWYFSPYDPIKRFERLDSKVGKQSITSVVPFSTDHFLPATYFHDYWIRVMTC